MKKTVILKIYSLMFMLAFFAGLIFFACAFCAKLPKNVTIDGIEVGGKSAAEAVRLVRGSIEENLKTKSLTIIGADKKYVFSYPEIGYKDNLQKLVKAVKKGNSYAAEVSFYLNGLSEISHCICDEQSRPVTEPYAIFNASGTPFTYCAGSDGFKADRNKLVADVRASLSGGFCDVKVEYKTLKRTETLSAVKNKTRLISAFTTYFDSSNFDRAHNIRLAAATVNGTVLTPGEVFSFNGVVGERTADRGFKSAKIIEKGEFVDGVGGGVCQVSTTLYNAALLAGCQITEFHPHSLAVSYVPPSCDAMVSGTYYDLKFKNSLSEKLYIRAAAGKGYVTFYFYGKSDGAQYSYASRVTGNIPAPEEVTDDPSRVKDGRDGILSEGYLTVTRGGIKKTVLYRKDKYLPLTRVVPQELPSEDSEAEQP